MLPAHEEFKLIVTENSRHIKNKTILASTFLLFCNINASLVYAVLAPVSPCQVVVKCIITHAQNSVRKIQVKALH